MGYDSGKPLPLPKEPPVITREQYYYEVSRQEHIDFENAGLNAATRKRKPSAKARAYLNPPASEWRNDEARETLEMCPTDDDFQYTNAARSLKPSILR